MKSSERGILVVDDEEGIRLGLERLFRRESFEPATAAGAEEALALAERSEFAAAVLDLKIDGSDDRGAWLLGELRARDPELAVVMITGYGSVESAVRAMKGGAADYILKPIDNAHLMESVRRALELRRLRRDNAFLKRELLATLSTNDIVTEDPRYLALVDLADRVKDSEATVLLTGESGTGKEVMARYIHFTGARRDHPFVGINCAALSESLLLSELFGHEKGSFTGAFERRLGKFEAADRGTLFLDEIGDMSLSVQSKLLRVLEESSFERVGGTRKVTVDIRVIAATNKDLPELIRRGDFREDLYYRINIVNLRLPPLRERRGDIPLLVDYFVRKYARKYNRPVLGVEPEVIQLWSAYDWPGNVRELQNAVNQAVLLCGGATVDLSAVTVNQTGAPPLSRRFDAAEAAAAGVAAGAGPAAGKPSGKPAGLPEDIDIESFAGLKELHEAVVERYERRLIEAVLGRENGNRSRTAAALGVTRKTLAEKMAAYGIEAGGGREAEPGRESKRMASPGG